MKPINNCKNCIYYTAYFQQLASGYVRLTHGNCNKHNKNISHYESCESFKSNQKRLIDRKTQMLNYLMCASKAISDISLILKDEQNNLFGKK